MGRGAVQRELENLVHAGLVCRSKKGNQVFYQANARSPIFVEIKSLMVKTAGLADVLRESLNPFRERITVAFVYGSLARGTDTANSDVDVMIIGELDFSDAVEALASSQESIGREVNPSVYPVSEFAAKLKSGNPFLSSLQREPRIFLIGDDDVFGRLVEKRVVG